jgi:scyllo-inositol 2-dehydrogenase (NADP+)
MHFTSDFTMNPINTALLSFGMSGKVFHAPFLEANKGFKLAGSWERSRKEIASLYPGTRSYDTLEELLADDSIELVIVNTPNYTHYDYAKRALTAGKHVIIEKPFVTSVAEGEELMALAESKGLVISVFQNRRWDSELLTIKRVLREGALGDIVEAAFHFDRFKESLSPKVHKEAPGPGAGTLYDLGPHLVDAALHLFGMPQSVFADIRILRPASEVDDYFEVLLYYPKLRVRLHSSYYVREAPPSFQLFGTTGTFLKARADVQEAHLIEGRKPGGPDWGAEPAAAAGLLHGERDGAPLRETVKGERGDYGHFFEAVRAALRAGAPAPVTATEGLQVVRIIEAAFQSAQEGCIITL